MSTNVSNVTSHFPKPQPGFTTTTSGAVSSEATTVGLNSTGNYSNGDIVALIIDPTDSDKKQVFVGTVDVSGSQITGVVWTDGSNQSHASGATVVDYWAATHIQMITKGMLVQHKQDGTHADTITTNTIGENTVGNGVTVDGLNLKDGKLNTNGSVSSTNLVEAFFRGRYQSNTTNSAPTGLTVQFGWGFVVGDASDGVQETITFPAAFSSEPIVFVSYIGARLTASGDPADPGDLTASPGDANRYVLAAATTTTTFEVTVGDVAGTSSSINYGYSWIAIGAV